MTVAAWKISKENLAGLVIALFGFFVGRVTIFGTVSPGVIAFAAPFFLTGANFYASCLFLALGVISKYNHFYSFKYLLCLGVLCVIQMIGAKKAREEGFFNKGIFAKGFLAGFSAAVRPLICALVLLACGLVFAIVNGASLYLAALAVFEAVLALSLGVIFQAAFVRIKSDKKTLENEDLAGVAILAAFVTAGCSDIYAGPLSLRYFCAFLIVFLSSPGGMTAGAACGLFAGLLVNLAGFEPSEFALICAVSGFAGGVFGKAHKVFVPLSFGIIFVIMAFYQNYFCFTAEHVFSYVCASLLFILAERGILLKLPAFTNPARARRNAFYSEKAVEIVTKKLSKQSEAFFALSRSFSSLAAAKSGLSKKDAESIVDDTVSRVCLECPKYNFCWKENKYQTYTHMYATLEILDKNGTILENDIPVEFLEACPDSTYFIASLYRFYGHYRTNMVWKNRIAESRRLIAEQSAGVSNTLKTMADEFARELKFDETAEDAIIAELAKKKISADMVIVAQSACGAKEVYISASGTKSVTTDFLANLVGNITGHKMRVEEENRRIGYYKFVERKELRIVCATACASKSEDEPSGDSYCYGEFDGSYILALSDGMGSGAKARRESTAAVDLIEEMAECGFNAENAVKLINSALLLKSDSETFSTIDICNVNLRTGVAEFIKIGAAATYIVRGDTIDAIRSKNLPAGILPDTSAEITKKDLIPGDIIIMTTDGVSDIYSDALPLPSQNPREIADFIIKDAAQKRVSLGKPPDDMTVIAAKIVKN